MSACGTLMCKRKVSLITQLLPEQKSIRSSPLSFSSLYLFTHCFVTIDIISSDLRIHVSYDQEHIMIRD